VLPNLFGHSPRPSVRQPSLTRSNYYWF